MRSIKRRSQSLLWLTGDRPLDTRVDDLTDRCSNESQAAIILWEEAELPSAMRALAVTYIAVPMKCEDSSCFRPQTADTIIAWGETLLSPCTALFVSDQPFCGYQFSIIKGISPDAVAFDLVGQGVNPDSHPAVAAITLDSLARWIYQEKVNLYRGCLD